MGVAGGSDWIYATHAARALAGVGGARDDLYIHFGHFDDPGVEGDDHFHAAQRALDDRILGLSRLADGMRVADVGCGVGGTLAHVDESFTGMDLHGVNVDPKQIEAARARVEPRSGNRLTWHVAPALHLPLAEASFDRVLAVEAIPHFGSRAGFLVEAARILADGGVLALSDFVPSPDLRAHRDRGLLPPGLVDAVAGLGPFEDFWGEGPGYATLAAVAALTPLDRVDATAATLPTYRFILRDDPEHALVAPETGLADRGVAALAWAQARGLVRMEYLSFQRRPR